MSLFVRCIKCKRKFMDVYSVQPEGSSNLDEIYCRDCWESPNNTKREKPSVSNPTDGYDNKEFVPSNDAYAIQHGGNHYLKLAIQPMEYAEKNGLSFAEGSIVKHVTRYRDKGQAEDLKKAIHYLQTLLQNHYNIKTKVEYSDQ